jgi:deoxyribonuclease-1-like protein
MDRIMGISVVQRKALAFGLVCVIAAAFASFYLFLQQDSMEEGTTVRIAAFNIQVFGRTKRQKDDVMAILTQIVREFDVVLIQEIRDSSKQTAPYFLQRINELDGPTYSYIRSERLGRTASKEAYAYFYNTETVEFLPGSDYVYNDVNDVFEREPYIASFRSDNFDFTLVGVHVRPDDAYYEINNLTAVISCIQEVGSTEGDIIVMGDLNADGDYFDEENTSCPFRAPEFHWLITNDLDTMVKTDYTYDRIVVLNATLNLEYMPDSASVFYFDQAYALSNATFVSEISDHYPVFAEYATNLWMMTGENIK